MGSLGYDLVVESVPKIYSGALISIPSTEGNFCKVISFYVYVCVCFLNIYYVWDIVHAPQHKV